MYTIVKTQKEHLEEYRKDYFDDVIAPMDDMWELGIIAKGDFYEIFADVSVGYFVVCSENTLLQLYIKKEYRCDGKHIIKNIINKKEIKKANVSTYEPYYLSLVLDLNKNVTINALLYTENVILGSVVYTFFLRTVSAQSASVAPHIRRS